MSEREEAPPVVVVELEEPQKETDESELFTLGYLCSPSYVFRTCATGSEKPPAYESLQRATVHELPKQSDATLIGELCCWLFLCRYLSLCPL